MQRLRYEAAPEAGRLLRVLLLRFGTMPPDANRAFRQDRRAAPAEGQDEWSRAKLGAIMVANGKQVSAILKPNRYWAALRPHLPRFSVEEQRAAVALYRELAKGEPVDDGQVARTLGLSIIETRAFLERETIKCLVYADDQGRVLGFGGLAATAMHHRFEVDGRALSTWCAWDSLFIPEILGRPARASSIDPE